jgi:hypothetical protein
MRTVRTAAIVAAVCAVTLVTGGTAAATSPVLTHGNDWARTYHINDDIISVHDGEDDQHHVGAGYYLNDGSYHVVADTNGPNNGGATHDWSATPFWITKFRVCESGGGGCTDYLPTDGPGGV